MTGVDYFTQSLGAVSRVEKAIGTDSEVSVSHEHRIYEGQRLLRTVFESVANGSLSLILVSSLTDAAQFLVCMRS